MIVPEDSESSTFSHLDSATVGKVLSEPSSTGPDKHKQAQRGNVCNLNKNQYNKINSVSVLTLTVFSLGNRLQIAVKLQYKQDKLPTTSKPFYLHGTPSISSIEFPRGTPSISSTGTPSIADGSQVIGDPSRSSRGVPSISPLSRGIPSNGTPSRSGDLG